MSEERGNMAVGAVVGGLIAGPVGAVAGTLVEKGPSQERRPLKECPPARRSEPNQRNLSPGSLRSPASRSDA